MKEKLLSDEEYLRTFFFVMAITFYNKKRVENPKIKIVAAQTGSGKSNLTAKLLREDENYILLIQININILGMMRKTLQMNTKCYIHF